MKYKKQSPRFAISLTQSHVQCPIHVVWIQIRINAHPHCYKIQFLDEI